MQKTERTDAEVIEAFLAGDRSGFGVLVERYVRLAGSIAYRILGDYERAADAAQDAFLKAHKSLPGLRDPNRFSSWFYGVVRTVALDHRRKLRRRPGSLTAMTGYEDLVPVELDPSKPLEHRELNAQVRSAVSTLSETYREVVVLKYLEGRSYQEIAEMLGVSVNAIESRLHRARRLLKGKLQGFARRSGVIPVEAD